MLCWGALLALGVALSADYQSRPGASGVTPATWPDAAPSLASSGRATLLMFVHPHCPCARASLAALAEMLDGPGRQFDAQIWMAPDSANLAIDEASDLWRQAARLPGAVVAPDDGGVMARLFGAKTSGYIALYDGAGRLQFSGGITAGRGQAGPNAGLDSVLAAMAGAAGEVSAFPVFGCPLFDRPERAGEPSTP